MTKEQFINDIPLDLAIRSHSGISFVPERRGQQDRESHAETMANDYADLAKLIAGKPEMQATLDTEFARYRKGYTDRTIAFMHANSRCVSTMITGASNFPVRQMEKRNNVAHKRLNELCEYRTRALDAIRKTLCPGLRPIMSGDADAAERLREKIADAEALQNRMKEANAVIRSNPKNQWTEEKQTQLMALGIRESHARELFTPDFCGRTGFADYELTNNGANIRRMKQRLEGIERNHATPETKVDGAFARIEDCPSENRIRLFFPGKPDENVRTKLKSGGFRWTPTLGCWQAYRNSGTFTTARAVAGIDWKDRCAPEFVATIAGLAERCGKTPDDVYRLWKEYSKNCESADQSPVMFEFQEWYKEQLQPVAA